MLLLEAFEPLIDLVFPPRCPLCGDGMARQRGVCAECWQDLDIPGEPCCVLCSRPFDGDMPDGLKCAPCLAATPRHDGVAAAVIYNDASRKLVLSFKHGGRIGLATTMADLLIPKLAFLDESWTLVPVPLHRWRLWRRGYNQAAELARAVSRRAGAGLDVDLLVRRKATQSLGGLGRRERRRAMAGAIAVNGRKRERVRGAKIVLVDDVLTSGATSDACVRALKRAGARQVVVACFARVID